MIIGLVGNPSGRRSSERLTRLRADPDAFVVRIGRARDHVRRFTRGHGHELFRPLPPHQKYGPQLPVLSKWPSML